MFPVDDLRPWADLPTPFVAIDQQTLARNIERIQRLCDDRGLALRPHAKTHKLVEIAALQTGCGAEGLTVASLGEAEAFAKAGFTDLFLAYSVFGTPQSAYRIAALCEQAAITVAVDSLDGVASLKGEGLQQVDNLSLVVELDSGLHRSGVTPDLAVAIARSAIDLGFRVPGVFTYPGHGYAPQQQARAALDEAETLHRAVLLFAQSGLTCAVRSGGSTPTLNHSESEILSEIRPGVYALNDAQQLVLGTCTAEDLALMVVSTVVSVPDKTHFVLDAGSKTLASDRPAFMPGHGFLEGRTSATVSRLWEHHAVVDVGRGGARTPKVGDRIAILPNHVCTVMNLANEVYTWNGSEVATWPLIARGANS